MDECVAIYLDDLALFDFDLYYNLKNNATMSNMDYVHAIQLRPKVMP